jgi:drug/metabolite transporter (DMT)-like permease
MMLDSTTRSIPPGIPEDTEVIPEQCAVDESKLPTDELKLQTNDPPRGLVPSTRSSVRRTQRRLSVDTVEFLTEVASQYKHYLLMLCIAYIVSAANEYWVVNWFKGYGVSLPIYFAILQNGSWPFQLLIYRKECAALPKKRILTKEMYKNYIVLGCLAAFIGLSRMYSFTILPPVLAVICSNTEIVFETAMTIFVLKKSVSRYQYSAVVLVLAGVISALYDPKTKSFGGGEGSNGDEKISSQQIFIGVGLSLISRFASSLNTVLAER